MQDKNSIEIFFPDIKLPLIIGVDDLHFYQNIPEGRQWSVSKALGYIFYTTNGIGFGVSKTIQLHRLLMSAKKGEIVDHINGNPLDNRRCNLRVVTTSQNIFNSRKTKNKTSSKYKGVFLQKRDLKWRAMIMYEGKKYHLGMFEDERLAAEVYDKKAKEFFGNHANLNFPSQLV